MDLILDPVRMIREICAQGGVIGIWGGLLNIPQVLGGLIFIGMVEGRAVLVTIFLTLIVAGPIHRRARFSRLTGPCHLPWLILWPWLIARLMTEAHGPSFRAG